MNAKDIAKELLRLSGRTSPENYKEFLDTVNVEAMKSDEVANAVHTFFSRYFIHSNAVFYAFNYRSGVGDKGLYKDVYDSIYPIVRDIFVSTIDIDKKKAMNLLSYLVINHHDRILKDVDKSILKTAMEEVSIVDHRKVFHIFRDHVKPKDIFDYFFDTSNEEVSTQYLFCLYLVSISLGEQDRAKTLEFIKASLPKSADKSDSDQVRRRILLEYTSGQTDIAPSATQSVNKTHLNSVNINKRRKIAVLVSGQLRNSHFSTAFPERYLKENFDVDVFVTTWNVRGAPPPHLSSLRGYDPDIRSPIHQAAIKYNVSSEEFAKKYHMSGGESVTYDQVRQEFQAKWCEVDVEGVSTPRFESNQARMFFKLAKIFAAARNEEYDCFIRIRPDLSFNLEKKVILDAVESCFSIPKVVHIKSERMYYSQMPLVDDNFAVASPQAMQIYASLWARRESNVPGLPLMEGTGKFSAHSSLGYWLMMNAVRIEFLAPVSRWKFNQVASIEAQTFVDHLKQLAGNPGIHQRFVSELIDLLGSKVP